MHTLDRESLRPQSLGRTDKGELVRAAFELQQSAKWIHILPLGQVDARDGRLFQVDDAAGVIAACELPMLVDWEHQSEFFTGSTKAAGWIEELAIEPGGSGRFPSAGIWGRVEWTPEGQKDVDGKAYRYVSPVLLLKALPPPAGGQERQAFERRTVLQVACVALTNTPALRMQSIDSFRAAFSTRLATKRDRLAAAKDYIAKQRAARGLPAHVALAPCTVTVEAEVASRLRHRGVSAAEETAARAYLANCKGRAPAKEI